MSDNMSDNMDIPPCPKCGRDEFGGGNPNCPLCGEPDDTKGDALSGGPYQPEAERVALYSSPLPTEDEATCLRMLTPLMKRYAVLARQRKQNKEIVAAEIKPIMDRFDAIDQKDAREQEKLLPLIEAWGRALLAHDDTRKSRQLQWGEIKTRHVAARVVVEDEGKLTEALARYGKEVPYNKPGKPTVSLSKLEGIIATLPTIPEGVVLVPSEERFSVEVAR